MKPQNPNNPTQIGSYLTKPTPKSFFNLLYTFIGISLCIS
ncbi:hypothetical protein Pf1_01328 [Flavobacterium columnare]|nr:hypothetical protein Pf1_00036 [Flavobacterium columnare]ANO49573.1 hypothetical protein Pf1_01328 [Flavobacterium columnare]